MPFVQKNFLKSISRTEYEIIDRKVHIYFRDLKMEYRSEYRIEDITRKDSYKKTESFWEVYWTGLLFAIVGSDILQSFFGVGISRLVYFAYLGLGIILLLLKYRKTEYFAYYGHDGQHLFSIRTEKRKEFIEFVQQLDEAMKNKYRALKYKEKK